MGSGLPFVIPKSYMLQFSNNFTNFIAVVHERKKTTEQPSELTLARAPSPWTEAPIAPEIEKRSKCNYFWQEYSYWARIEKPKQTIAAAALLCNVTPIYGRDKTALQTMVPFTHQGYQLLCGPPDYTSDNTKLQHKLWFTP